MATASGGAEGRPGVRRLLILPKAAGGEVVCAFEDVGAGFGDLAQPFQLRKGLFDRVHVAVGRQISQFGRCGFYEFPCCFFPRLRVNYASLARDAFRRACCLNKLSLVKVGRGRVCFRRRFAMFCKRKSILSCFAILGLSIFTNVNVVNAAPRGPFCTGQYASASDCAKKAGGVWIQGVPLNTTNCQTTCQNHPTRKFLGCVDINAYAAKLCANRHPLVTRTFPIAGGNRCGYGWFMIDCQ
jgi:hypothetical protein